MRFEPPSTPWRGKLANLIAAVQQQKPEQGERVGKLRCFCGATVHFNVQASGISRGQCSAGCGVRWVQ